MTSARLRYVALLLAAVVFAAMACLYTRAGLLWPGGLGTALLCLFCAEGASYVRQAAARLQRLELEARPPEVIEPWANWCCESGWITRGDLHNPTHCTKERS